MSENIKSAIEAANHMAEDCQSKIDELKALKEVYTQLGKAEEHENDPDNAGYELRHFVEGLQESDYPFPIRGIFTLAGKYHSLAGIDESVTKYTETEEYWIKIRDQLSAE